MAEARKLARDVVPCPRCGARNRLKAAPNGQVPACGRCGASLPWLQTATDADFEAQISAGVPVLVDFWAAWCGPCRIVDPVVRSLAEERAGTLKVVKLDIDENPATAQRFQVMSIPTLILFRDGAPVDTIVGAVPKRDLEARLAPHLGG